MRARPNDTTEALAGTWFGSHLPAAARERLAPQLRIVAYSAGTEILREGEPMHDLGIVVDGRVALRLRVPERGPTTILTVEAGDVVGWSAVVPPHRASDTAVAMLPTELLLIDAATLRAELAADCELATAVYRSLLEALARRLTGTRLQLMDLFTTSERDPW